MHREHLLQRLDEIIHSVEETGKALAVLGLGSIGEETDRLDEYSDLDFFVIVPDGCKDSLLEDLTWLERVAPVTYSFRNTPDGYKVLFEDGIFVEMAVLTPEELPHIEFSRPRVLWHVPGFDPGEILSLARLQPLRQPSQEWLVGEALTNLYVGLQRYARGEQLSAARFIQGYAVDRVVELSPFLEEAQEGSVDPYNPDRRYEQRFPVTARSLPHMIQGYERIPQSALAVLAFLDAHFTIDPTMKQQILDLCSEDEYGA